LRNAKSRYIAKRIHIYELTFAALVLTPPEVPYFTTAINGYGLHIG